MPKNKTSQYFLLFPNQLFDFQKIVNPHITKHHRILLVEHPAFVGDRLNMKLNLNKLRLTYQRYLCVLYARKNRKVTFIPCDNALSHLKEIANGFRSDDSFSSITFFDPLDHDVMASLQHLFSTTSITVLDTPAFILSDKEVLQYCASKREKKVRLRHAPFYAYVKNKLAILQNIPSQDKLNRAPPPKSAEANGPSPFPEYKRNQTKERVKLLRAAANWAESNFQKNPGPDPTSQQNLQYLSNFPANAEEANVWLELFIRERFPQFGKTQDAIIKGQQWMHHSGLSIPLNYGLITPTAIVERVMRITDYEMQNLEGFVRQVIGWREYCRLYYVCVPPETYQKNHFGHPKAPLQSKWYNGTTGVPIVDDAISDAWSTGYLHHIRRLMIMSNFMTISKIHPDEVYRWFYEFALDSNDVLMIFNCYSMGAYSDGGAATVKPYISGPAYVKRQARERTGPWEKVWRIAYDAHRKK